MSFDELLMIQSANKPLQRTPRPAPLIGQGVRRISDSRLLKA